ncbi:polymerase [Streptococcus sp. 10F2]
MNRDRFFSDNIYLLTLFIWIIYCSLLRTTYFSVIEGFSIFYRPLLYITLILLALKEFIDFPRTIREFINNPSKLLIFLAFVLVFLIRSRNRDQLLDINVLMLTFSARTVSYKKLLATFSLATFMVLAITIFASSKEYIANMIQKSDVGYRYSLGFGYVSYASQRMFFGLCSYMMFRGKRISIVEIMSLLIMTVYLYGQTGTSSPYYLSLLFIGYVFISCKLFKKDFIIENNILSFMARWSFVLATLVLMYLFYFAPSSIFQLMDEFTNNRLRLSVEGYRNFGVSLLGRRLQFTTLDIFGNFLSNYNYIDSSIVQSMVIDGLFYYLFFAVYGIQKSIDYFIQLRKEIVVVGMVVMVLHSMFDPQLFVLLYSPLLLMLSRIFRVEVEVDGLH